MTFSEILSPSDLARHTGSARRSAVTVAGRVRCEASGRWQIADAFASVPVDGFAADAPEDGSLVVVEGHWSEGRLEQARLLRDLRTKGGRQQGLEREKSAEGLMREPGGEALRLFDCGVGRGLCGRARAMKAIRGWFDDHGFIEVQTPQRVVCPGLDVHLDAFASPPRFLITSPEYQMKRLLVGGVPRLYQVVGCFRKDERGDLHNSEFTMLEWYRAFATVEQIMEDTERLIQWVAQELSGEASLWWRGKRVDVTVPFERITVAQAFEAGAGLSAEEVLALAQRDEDRYFELLVDRVEPWLATRPAAVMLTQFPSVHASLAKVCDDDPRWCERFEVYAAGVELCNGFGELTDPVEQRARFDADLAQRERMGKPVYPVDERFLRALEEGMPPSGGNALGVDRLVALALGAKSIGEVMAFPDDWV